MYRLPGGNGALATDDDSVEDKRDYDAEYYVRQLRDTFGARFMRAFRPNDFAVLFADPEQLSLFASSFEAMRTVLTSTAALSAPVRPPEWEGEV